MERPPDKKAEIALKEELTERGVLRLEPSFVARDHWRGLKRLGIEEDYIGKRGWICERWIASCVETSVSNNPHRPEDEGLTFISLPQKDLKLSFKDALLLAPEQLLGKDYSKTHDNQFGVLSKLLDIGTPIPLHIHPGEKDAKTIWNMNPKEEAYYFVESDNLGSIPYSHLGVHPFIEPKDFLPILKRWNDDKTLDLSPAYRLNIREGFHLFPGIPHAPGTALTLELQEESDISNLLHPVVDGKLQSRERMLKGLKNEEEVLDLIDWEKSKDPEFYHKYHTTAEKIIGDEDRSKEYWVFNPNRTRKFSGKEIRIPQGETYESVEKGAYVILAWKGEGVINGIGMTGGNPDLDELLISYETATTPHKVTNIGKEELVFYKIFGPDVNMAPIIYD